MMRILLPPVLRSAAKYDTISAPKSSGPLRRVPRHPAARHLGFFKFCFLLVLLFLTKSFSFVFSSPLSTFELDFVVPKIQSLSLHIQKSSIVPNPNPKLELAFQQMPFFQQMPLFIQSVYIPGCLTPFICFQCESCC